MRTLVILNPYAGNGRVGREWPTLAPLLRQQLGDLFVVKTQTASEVRRQLEIAHNDGIRRALAVGGDGTNFVVVNALMNMARQNPQPAPMTLGILPVGTGRDWARGRGIPLNLENAVQWLAQAQPTPVDVGRIDVDGADQPSYYFLNVASAGMGGDVDSRIQTMATKRPWSFLQATINSILQYDAQHMRVTVDGDLWLDQPLTVVAVANGTIFGHGMRIAPTASVSDGLFDVIVLDKMSRLRILRKLWHVYNATHLKEVGVYFRQAREVQIISREGKLPLDMDGELAHGRSLRFCVEPGALQMLL